MPRAAPQVAAPPRGLAEAGLTRRAFWTGIILVTLIALLAPYNDDLSPKNAPFIGNHFPISIITLLAALILLVNPALQMLRRRPFSQRELIVIATLMLVAAAVPTSGLMRYLEPMLLGTFYHAQLYPDSWRPVAELIPAWLVPTKDPNSPLISHYWQGIDPILGGHVPILPFLLPAGLWLILLAAILGAALFLAAIFRRQWVHHERLTFPLATIPLELMAPPEEGRAYNKLWRNPLLWAGMAIPALVYLLGGLHAQFPAVPMIDLHYDFQKSFSDPPWKELPLCIQSARLYLAVVGICFFVPSEIAFSMWLFMVLAGLARVAFPPTESHAGVRENLRAMGVYVGYFAGLLWLARAHLNQVLTAAWRRAPRDELEPVTYRTMVLGLAICAAVAWAWLSIAGMNPLAALLLLGLGTILVTLMARVVAETGLFFVGPVWWPRDFVRMLLGPAIVGKVSFYWTQIISAVFYGDLRETLMPFAANSLRMGQELKYEERPRWFGRLILALLISVVASAAMHHYLSYTRSRDAIGDAFADTTVPREVLSQTFDFNRPPELSLPTAWSQFGLGALMVAALMVGRVMWAGWPFHPIGLVLMGSGPMQQVWFSIFIGWGVKRLLLRYGGAMAFRRARPMFIGLILGEMLGAGVWMFVGLATGGAVRYAFLPN